MIGSCVNCENFLIHNKLKLQGEKKYSTWTRPQVEKMLHMDHALDNGYNARCTLERAALSAT